MYVRILIHIYEYIHSYMQVHKCMHFYVNLRCRSSKNQHYDLGDSPSCPAVPLLEAPGHSYPGTSPFERRDSLAGCEPVSYNQFRGCHRHLQDGRRTLNFRGVYDGSTRVLIQDPYLLGIPEILTVANVWFHGESLKTMAHVRCLA